MDQVSLQIGDEVYVARAEEPEGALIIIPVELLATWLERGRKVSLEPESSPALD
jgi:hypothetical protein